MSRLHFAPDYQPSRNDRSLVRNQRFTVTLNGARYVDVMVKFGGHYLGWRLYVDGKFVTSSKSHPINHLTKTQIAQFNRINDAFQREMDRHFNDGVYRYELL
jgi:hypothetical protein